MKIGLIVLAVVGFIGLLAYMSMGQKQHRVEVCVEFNGQKNCRIAAGPTREAALRTATENACATITNGMTESMSCGHKPPISSKWLD
jgi:hypothetical protein